MCFFPARKLFQLSVQLNNNTNYPISMLYHVLSSYYRSYKDGAKMFYTVSIWWARLEKFPIRFSHVLTLISDVTVLHHESSMKVIDDLTSSWLAWQWVPGHEPPRRYGLDQFNSCWAAFSTHEFNKFHPAADRCSIVFHPLMALPNHLSVDGALESVDGALKSSLPLISTHGDAFGVPCPNRIWEINSHIVNLDLGSNCSRPESGAGTFKPGRGVWVWTRQLIF